jgi:hypothetical protein
MSQGLFSSMFQGMLPPSVKPQLSGQELVIRLTAQEFREMALKNIDAKIAGTISIAIVQDAIEIRVKVI